MAKPVRFVIVGDDLPLLSVGLNDDPNNPVYLVPGLVRDGILCRTICLPTSVNSSSTLPWISLRNSRIREVQSMCLSRSNLYTFVMYSYLGVIDKVNGSLISAYITAGSMFPDS